MGASIGVVVAFSAGLFSFLSPCVLPLFPSYLSFITGMSVADLSQDLTASARRRVLLHAVTFVLGFSVVFVALGASFSAAGQLLFQYRSAIRVVGGILIVIFGLYIAGLLNVGLFARTQQWQIREKPAGYVGSALGSFLRFFKRYRPFIPVVERGAGVLLIAVGVLVATNYYVILNSWAISLTPEWLLRRL